MYDILLEISDGVGIVGVVLILIAYYYLSVGKWISDSMIYQVLNFLGAWLILFSLYFHWNLSSVVIEVAWIVISLIEMYRVGKMRDKVV
jgi:multisubunit Na+/H+ antiporter MnhB subunit